VSASLLSRPSSIVVVAGLAELAGGRVVRLKDCSPELVAAKSERPIPSVGRDDRPLLLLLCMAPGVVYGNLPAVLIGTSSTDPRHRMDRVTLLRDGVSGDGG
jgi:hypothetical protein